MVAKLNPKELAILSLINEKPSHAYTLEEKIEHRGMRNWTDIGFSSIYRIITNLEKKGHVKSEIIQEDDDARIKKRYTITKKGQSKLKDAVQNALAAPERPKSVFDLGLANIWLLNKEEAISALALFLQSVKDRREVMYKNWNQAGGKGNIPFLIDALFEHGEVMINAEMKFVEELIKKIKKHGITDAIDK
ncbi:MAG: PadR family transcriptional regulator [Candidatus Heimdallarchaeota archaeon]|nr:MAG: PadR family transcriptional regulator [Candidatus Heimdallarchaeota archaeon]